MLLARTEPDAPAAVEQLGQGWVAEEALAISLYCALAASSFESALVLAVNHDGDSDSTGSITGNILGALLGEAVIPSRWLEPLEARDILEQMADDLASVPQWNLDEHASSGPAQALLERYPPW